MTGSRPIAEHGYHNCWCPPRMLDCIAIPPVMASRSHLDLESRLMGNVLLPSVEMHENY